MTTSTHKRRRDAAYRKGFAEGRAVAATTMPLQMGSFNKPTVEPSLSSTGPVATHGPDSAASDDSPQSMPSDARTESDKRDENNVALGMAIAATIIMRTWGQDTYAREILSAAGLTTKTRMREVGAENYDLETLSPLIDEGAA